MGTFIDRCIRETIGQSDLIIFKAVSSLPYLVCLDLVTCQQNVHYMYIVHLQLKRQEIKIRKIEEERHDMYKRKVNEYIMLVQYNADQLLDSVVRYSNEYYY